MMDAESLATRINAYFAQKRPSAASAPSVADNATFAAQTRWAGRGGPSVTIRISTALAARLYAAIPQPDRRPFVEAAIESRLAPLEAHVH